MSATAAAGRRVPAATRARLVECCLAVALLASIAAAVMLGPTHVSPGEVWGAIGARLGLGEHAVSPIRREIVWEIRLPRVLLAAVVGAGLALVGATMQAVTRNPLADPYLLGISAGASLGAVLVLVLGVGAATLGVAGGAFAGALAAFATVLAIAGRVGRLTPVATILAGVAVASICNAVVSVIVVVAANPNVTRSVVFWTLGSLAGARWPDLRVAVPALVVAGSVCLLHARALNALAFGEDDAAGLGVSVQRVRAALLVAGALLTAALVAVSGPIGFVGLLLPHAVRPLCGGDHRRLLPVVALTGATFLIWADTLARVAFDPVELPVGAITALCGAPALALILHRRSAR